MPEARSRTEDNHTERPRGGWRSEHDDGLHSASRDGEVHAIRAEFGELGAKSVKAGLRLQREMFDVFQTIGRDWMMCATSEAELALDLSNRLASVHSAPDAISAYQGWLSEWLALCGEDGRRLISDGRKIVNTGRLLAMA